MKSSNVHAILSEVYRLLGEYTAADFAEASKYKGMTPPLRDALRALTREATTDSKGTSGEPTDSANSKPNRVVAGTSLSDRPDPMLEIVKMFRQSKRFGSTQSILQFAKDVGLSVQARPKESRERLARRVAEAILLTQEPRRSHIVAQLAGDSDSQTQGWIDVIKNPRP